MTFDSVYGDRPVRLSEETRQFAYDSLHHRYGKDTNKTPGIVGDDIADFESLNEIEKYDIAVKEIAINAPIRICDGERISGAATLGVAISHQVPFLRGGNALCSSVSHLTIDFETVLKIGIDGIEKNIADSLHKHTDPKKIRFLESCQNVVDAMRIWHNRYLDALKGSPEYSKNYHNLLKVPFSPAENFYEAVQSLWFTFAFVRLCGNWPGIGRIDNLLGNYLKKDLVAGKITLEEAREILAHFFIKGCEWVSGGDYGSGDAQHYQNIVLSGIDEDGNDITNEVTYLVLEIIEELGISDFPTTVRLNSRTDEKLKRRIAEVMRHGGGILAVYNENLILKALIDYGYPLREARKFANDGCWEVQIPGKTFFKYIPFDSLALLQQITLKDYSEEVDFSSFEQLLSSYENDLRGQVHRIIQEWKYCFSNTAVPTKDWRWKPTMPCTVVSVFEKGCIEKGQSYLEGGPVYNVVSPHIGGLPDTVNSLYAIKKLVFDDRKVTFSELMEILRNNWQNNESLRQYAVNHYRYFGNGNDEIDLLARNLLEHFADFCREEGEGLPIRFPSGVSTFGRQINWAPLRKATPSGNFAGQVLSGNLSATPGTDIEGVTALISSYCKCNLARQTTGAALDVKLLAKNIRDEAGITALTSLMDGFVHLGGFFMQPDVADAACLRDAQEHPENYPTLAVRVSGWNARFVTLNRQWQDMIIGQVEGTV